MITTPQGAPLPKHLAALILNHRESGDELIMLLKLFYGLLLEINADTTAQDAPELKAKLSAALEAAEKGL